MSFAALNVTSKISIVIRKENPSICRSYLALSSANLPLYYLPVRSYWQVHQPSASAKKSNTSHCYTKATPAFTYKTISAANGTYGYDIYADGKLRIHRPAVSAMPGNGVSKVKL